MTVGLRPHLLKGLFGKATPRRVRQIAVIVLHHTTTLLIPHILLTIPHQSLRNIEFTEIITEKLTKCKSFVEIYCSCAEEAAFSITASPDDEI